MNALADLKTLKSSSYLNLSENGDDVYLRHLLEAVSRQIEGITGRKFYSWTGIRYFDGKGYFLWLPDDLLAISELKLDEDGDGTYEALMTASDYYEWPYNTYPRLRLDINPNGSYGGFASGIQKGVKLTGTFGYADSATPYHDSGDTVQDDPSMSATQTTITVSNVDKFSPGMTLLVESEQMYVSEVGATTLTITRGVNGTDAATHVKTKAIYIYDYPRDIAQAVLITAMRAWKRKDSSYQDVVGSPELGQLVASKGMDPDVLELVKPFKRQRYV